MSILVRRRRDDDIPTLAQVLVRVYAQDGYPVEGVENPRSWLTPPRELAAWAAVFDDRPIGHISITRADHTDEVAVLWQRTTGRHIDDLAIPVRLFVDPNHRRRGAGELLMLAARNFASDNNMTVAFDVMLKDRDAIHIYERAGCRRIGVITHQHSGGKYEPAAVYVVSDT